MNQPQQTVSRAQRASGRFMPTRMMVIIPCLVLLWVGVLAAQHRGHLGVFIQNVPRTLDGSSKPHDGVVILGLMRNGPAELSGLRRGDIILKFNGMPVHQVEDLQRLLRDASPDETAEIEVFRRNQTLIIPVKLAPAPTSLPVAPTSESFQPMLQREGLFWAVLVVAGLLAIVLYLTSAQPWQHWHPVRSTIMLQMARTRVSHYQVGFVAGSLLIVVLLWSSLIIVEPGHRGVVFHLLRGVQNETLREGIHFRLAGLYRTTLYDTRSRAYHVQNLTTPPQPALSQGADYLLWTPTADGLKVGLDLSVRYRLDPSRISELHRSVGPEFETKLVYPIVWNVVRLVASEYSLLDIYGRHRREMQQHAFNLVQEHFARDGLIAEDLLLRDIVYTQEFEKTLVEKMVAEQKIQEAVYEVQQSELHAQVEIIEAQGEAQALELVNQAIRDQPLVLNYFWIKSLPEHVRVVVVPNRTGKQMPLIQPVVPNVQGTRSRGSQGG